MEPHLPIAFVADSLFWKAFQRFFDHLHDARKKFEQPKKPS